jgi:hypothetical protein
MATPLNIRWSFPVPMHQGDYGGVLTIYPQGPPFGNFVDGAGLAVIALQIFDPVTGVTLDKTMDVAAGGESASYAFVEGDLPSAANYEFQAQATYTSSPAFLQSDVVIQYVGPSIET